VSGAKREGEVADYASTNHQMSGPLIKLFEKKYPFITVKLAFKESRPKLRRDSMPWMSWERASWVS